jgi:cobalt transporter subunit CbtA
LLSRILVVGLVAGFVAGAAMAAVQHFEVTPLIAAAEVYESAAASRDAASTPQAGAVHEHEQEWEPAAGFERAALTFLADLIVAIGFGLVLSGGFALRQSFSSRVPDAREGLLWGMAGFAAFALAPALGLPPEPPGMAVADIYARQGWWLGTAAATCGGLGLIAFARGWALRLAGAALLIIPHLVGAPVAPAGHDAVPAAVAAHFVAASLVTAAVFWAVLGPLAGWLYAAMERHALAPRASRQTV